MATFVRLKRKRNEEPTDSILVACKKGKQDVNASKDGNLQNELFKLAGTVNSKDDNQLKIAIDSYNNKLSTGLSAPLHPIHNSSASKTSANKAESRLSLAEQQLLELEKPHFEQTKEELTKLFQRPFDAPDTRSHVGSSSSKVISLTGHQSIRLNQETSSRSAPSSDRVVVYDAVLKPGKVDSLLSGLGVTESSDIPCHGGLTPHTASGTGAIAMSTDTTEDDYVYDIFCVDGSRSDFDDLYDEIREIFTIETYSENFGPFGEYRSDRLFEDDDDDSNDEDNWRNDYPDEMDSCESGDEENPFGEGVLRRSTYLDDGGAIRFDGLTLASSEDSSSGNEESNEFKADNPEFDRYYKSYKKSCRRSRDSEVGEGQDSSEEEAYSDGYDDL